MTTRAERAAMDYGDLLATADEFLPTPDPPTPDPTAVAVIAAEALLHARARPLLAPPVLPGDKPPPSLAVRAKEFLTPPPAPIAGPSVVDVIAADAGLWAQAHPLLAPPALPGDEPPLPLADRAKDFLVLRHLPGEHSQKSHGGGGAGGGPGAGDDGGGSGGSGGGGGDDDDDDGGEVAEPTKMASKKAGGDYTARAVDDPDGTLLALDPSGNPNRYVEVVEDGRDPIGEGTFYSPSDARAIAGEVDVVAAQARLVTPPSYPDDLGPALIAQGRANGYPIAAYYDKYGDLQSEGSSFLAIGERGGSAGWDTAELRPDLADARVFASALREMADVSDGVRSRSAVEAITADALLRAEALSLLAPPPLPGDEPPVSVTASIVDADLPGRAKEFLALPRLRHVLVRHLAGQHSQKSHGGGGTGTGPDGGGGGGSDGDGATGAGGGGGNPSDEPYAEWNLDEDGNPRFSKSYTEKYGRVRNEYNPTADGKYAIAVTEKGYLHIADDSAGTLHREVIEDFKGDARDVAALGDDIWDVNNGDKSSTERIGIDIKPRIPGELAGVEITWTSGRVDGLDWEDARDLAESFSNTDVMYQNQFGTTKIKQRSRVESPTGAQVTAAITSTAQLRAVAAEFLAPPDLPADVQVTAAITAGAQLRAEADDVMADPHLRHLPGEHSQKSHGGGGALTGQAALDAAPAALTTDRKLVAPAGAGDAESLSAYRSIRYVEINGHLRGTYEGPNTAVTIERVAQIDKTMRVSRLRDDVEVYRVVKDGRAAYGDAYSRDSDLTGMKWREDAYVSLTADTKIADELSAGAASISGGSPVVLTARIPAGTGAINLDGRLGELLAERGLTFEATADHGIDADGIRRLDVTVVPE